MNDQAEKKDLKILISLYEGLSVYVPRYEQIEIRKKTLAAVFERLSV